MGLEKEIAIFEARIAFLSITLYKAVFISNFLLLNSNYIEVSLNQLPSLYNDNDLLVRLSE